jgi:hypothetical protein
METQVTGVIRGTVPREPTAPPSPSVFPVLLQLQAWDEGGHWGWRGTQRRVDRSPCKPPFPAAVPLSVWLLCPDCALCVLSTTRGSFLSGQFSPVTALISFLLLGFSFLGHGSSPCRLLLECAERFIILSLLSSRGVEEISDPCGVP